MHDVIVCDEEFESVATFVQKACNKIDLAISSYLNIMDNAKGSGVVSGDTAKALDTYIKYAQRLKDVAGSIAEQHSTASQFFLDAVDAADDYLY